jgi:hypothetical protein
MIVQVSCRRCRDILWSGFTKMKRKHAPALAIGIGAAAGLRPMTTLAVIAWALRRGSIRPGRSPFVGIVSASASKRLAELAIKRTGCGQVALYAEPVECCTARVTCRVRRNLWRGDTRHTEATGFRGSRSWRTRSTCGGHNCVPCSTETQSRDV